MNDLDLDDIETHLYGQIYHSSERSDGNFHSQPLENFEEPTPNTMGNQKRYFQKSKKKTTRTGGVVDYLLRLNPNMQDNHVRTNYLYTRDSGRRFRPLDVPFSQAFQINKNAQKPVQVPVNQEFSVKNKIRFRIRRRQKRAAAKRFKLQQNKVDQQVPKEPPQTDVITLSDSDGESCVEIANKRPVVSVTDSDDEMRKRLNQNGDLTSIGTDLEAVTCGDTGDDVIFVEPTNTPIEIINVDDETDSSPQKYPTDTLGVNAHADLETASVTSSNNSFINAYSLTNSTTTKNLHQERKELLSTPDSALNDFITNTGVEKEKDNFNFSLHGKDFNSDKFVKPTNPSETCETESSSSTTDPNALNTIKTIVFNEVEFPKEGIFAEANLETFSNFITPLRKSALKKITQSSTPVDMPSQSQNVYSSDSSSESDFDDGDTNCMRKSKKLPELSPMLESKSLQAVKKHKTALNISSKYDLVGTDSSEIVKPVKEKKRKSSQLNDPPTDSETNFSKKKNKNKKRKSDSKGNKLFTAETEDLAIANLNSNGSPLNASIQNYPDEAIEGEVKRKKKKSRELSEEIVENSEANYSKKKTKTKKKRSLTEAEPTDENEIDPAPSVQQKEDTNDESQEKPDLNIDNSSYVQLEINTKLTEAYSLKEPPSCNSHIRFDTDVAESENIDQIENLEDLTQIPTLKTEQSTMEVIKDHQSENVKCLVEDVPKMASDEAKSESFEDVMIIETGPDVPVLLLSDSESNLSPLNDHQDVQLVNCNQPQEINAALVNHSGNSTVTNLTNSSVAEVLGTMTNDPKMWTILDTDRMPFDKTNTMNRRCNRCREKGHMAVKCSNSVAPKCRLCGERGHFEPRCPNRICTQCGTKRHYSTTVCNTCVKYRNHKCELCFMAGHPSTACPDLWRRYHMTTSEGPLRCSNRPLLKPKHKLWCSSCAKSGHLEYTCRYYKSMYPPSDPRIKSYEDVYEDKRPAEVEQVAQPLYIGINNYNGNYNLQHFQQRYPLYHNSVNFGMNFVDNGMFVNNQGNFLQSGGENMALMQTAQFYTSDNDYLNQHCQINQQFFFEDNLPNYISFENPMPSSFDGLEGNTISQGRYFSSDTNVPNPVVNTTNNRNVGVIKSKPLGSIFFASPVQSVRHFIMEELQGLLKMSQQLHRVVQNLRRQLYNPKGDVRKMNKTLNMVLFGIYKMNDGGRHLIKLKKFKASSTKARLSQSSRKDLHKSYCYIFGNEKHYGVDYTELLSRI